MTVQPLQPGTDFAAAAIPRAAFPPTALEVDFPAAVLSRLAERESWRKEVQRPATHTHKWWAQRLGTVFRGLLAAATTETAGEALKTYRTGDLTGLTVLDPFAGSGTTLVEAVKLGARAVGVDINPVATLVQRQGVAGWDLERLHELFAQVEAQVRAEIERLHTAVDGRPVLYYFWVAQANCMRCDDVVDLFSSRLVARDHTPGRRHRGRALCPHCGAFSEVASSAAETSCTDCGETFLMAGAVRGATMTCHRGHLQRVVDALADVPPRHRLYGTLVLGADGRREYRRATVHDDCLVAEAERLLAAHRHRLVLPSGELEDGHNTRQVMRWGYRRWEQLFNARQLYSLGLLGAAVRDLPHCPEREALAALFSGTLEFNNLLCSYKGEGTGAVRHAFAHHVLRPERVPLEAHPWGTPASSGSFSTLFASRLLRAHAYKAQPHDLVPGRGRYGGTPARITGASRPLGGLSDALDAFLEAPTGAHARWGDGARTGLPDGSVDLVLTDPPFMDNVHYSELADFFHAWLRQLRPWPGYPTDLPTTRTEGEVQSADPADFEAELTRVWQEAARVLRPGGLLVFTFHQARIEGWLALVRSLRVAGFAVTAVQPIKGEMSTSVVKAGATEPSNLDSVLVCRHADGYLPAGPTTPTQAASAAGGRLERLAEAGIRVGPTDVVSVVRGSVLALHTRPDAELHGLADLAEQADALVGPVVERIAALPRRR